MEQECNSFIGRLFGHDYQPRYSTGPGDFTGMKGSLHACRTMMEEAKSKTYVCDVCTRCGKVIKHD